jgi:hypothetical protein
MKKTIFAIVAALGIGLTSASVQADDIAGFPYEGLGDLDGYCEFDSLPPADKSGYPVLTRNFKLSLNSDITNDCIVFEIWAGAFIEDENGIIEPGFLVDDQDILSAIRVPRAAGTYAWQQCRFSNVITQQKIDELILSYANDQELVKVMGICGSSVDDSGDIIPTGYVEAIVKVDSD